MCVHLHFKTAHIKVKPKKRTASPLAKCTSSKKEIADRHLNFRSAAYFVEKNVFCLTEKNPSRYRPIEQCSTVEIPGKKAPRSKYY